MEKRRRQRAGQATASRLHKRIYEVVSRVPRGRVVTYGQVAELAGLPRQARLVGYALHALDAEAAVPWQRVINARGEVSRRSEPGLEELQRSLLEAEGIPFDGCGRVDLARYRWNPRRAVQQRVSSGVELGRGIECHVHGSSRNRV